MDSLQMLISMREPSKHRALVGAAHSLALASQSLC